MSAWETAQKKAADAQSGTFLRLKKNGDKFVGAFIGQPETKEFFYNAKTEKYEAFTAEHAKEGKKASVRFSMNFLLPGTDTTAPSVKIFEMSSPTFTDLLAARAKYKAVSVQGDLEYSKAYLEIVRSGEKGDTNTTYSVLFDHALSADEEKLAAAIVQNAHPTLRLHDLKHIKDEDDTQTDLSSHDKAKSGNGAHAAAPAPTNGGLISNEEKMALVTRIKALPDNGAKITAFLAKFGIAKVGELPAARLGEAKAEVDSLEGKNAPAPAAASPWD